MRPRTSIRAIVVATFQDPKAATSARPMIRQRLDEYVQRVRTSRAFVFVVVWIGVVASHPWTRACHNAWCHAFAWLVGDTFEDERVAFSKRRLVVNDSYRDRLLAAEIADLVDLCDALQLSIEQRKAFFRCFLHLDYLRHAGVSRSELLRYCGLRETPAARFLLPSDGAFAVEASAHRREEFRTQRWDILQLLALAFSLCTIEPSTLVDLCSQEIAVHADQGPHGAAGEEADTRDVMHDQLVTHEGADGDEVSHDRVATSHADDSEESEVVRDRLGLQIYACLAFSYGVPSPIENKLAAFLCRLYCNDDHSQPGKVDFVGVHGINSAADIITLFPVLLFPCVWLQRVVKQRILGHVTWRKLALRRAELQLAGLAVGFASVADILAAAEAHRQHRYRHTAKERDHAPQPERSQGSLSTPRKILPVEEKTLPSDSAQSLHSCIADLQNEDDAWRATADSLLASVLVLSRVSHDAKVSTGMLDTDEAAALFDQTRREIQSRTLSQSSVSCIQRELIQSYGYQFMAFVFAKSSIQDASGELVCTASVRKDLRRATQRHRKADEGTPLVEDKAIYWKKHSDPVLKRVFYHNVRTGESRWEMPTTLVARRRKKRKRSLTRNATSERTFV